MHKNASNPYARRLRRRADARRTRRHRRHRRSTRARDRLAHRRRWDRARRDGPARRERGRRADVRSTPSVQPALAFKDRRDYFVAPAGDFEDPSLPGWQLPAEPGHQGSSRTPSSARHRRTVCRSRPAARRRPPRCASTSTTRSSASSPPSSSPDTDSELVVDVIYPALTRNNVREAKKFRLKAKDGWELSDDIKLEPQRLGKRAGWRRIAIRFRVESRQEGLGLSGRRHPHRPPRFN